MHYLLSLLALTLLWLPDSAQAFDIPAGTVTVRESQDANGAPIYYMQIDGAIAAPMPDQMSQLLATLKPDEPLLLNLNSPGGSSGQGKLIIAMLQDELKKGRNFSTSVENGQICASMCVPLFMQAPRRYAGEGSLFMFHGAIEPDYSNVPDFYATEDLLRIFTEAGMNPSWIDDRRKEGVFTEPGSYWISGRELYDAKSDVITRLIPRHVVDEPWHASIDPQLGPK